MAIKKSTKIKILMSILFVAIFLGLLFFLFSGENFNVLKEIFNTNATKEDVQNSIGKLGYRAYFVVIIIAMLQVVFTFIPGEPLHVISGISFGLWKGMLICLIGIILGNTVIYILQKIFGKKLTEFFETNINVDFAKAGTSKKLALIVIILYCLPAIPYGIICFFAASIGMKYPKYIIITGIGSIPSLFLDVGLGHIAMSTSWIISISVFVIILILLILMFRFKNEIFAKVNNYIAKTNEKENRKVGHYNPFIYHLVGDIVYSAIKCKVKIKLKKNIQNIEKPSIILCNHASFYDFVYAGKLLRKERPHFIVARLYFQSKTLGNIISGTGAFPKSMFTIDIESSKNCMKVISNGEVLAMMPEARLSTIGTFEDIQENTYKFIKKMNVPVYVINISGSYFAKPKWGDKIRKGAKVYAELTPLFTKDDIAKLSHTEIKEKVDNSLQYNDWEWLKKNPDVHYKHKNLAKGIENILSICPECNQKYTLSTYKNYITCTKCGHTCSMTDRYQLDNSKFKTPYEWYNWQKEVFTKELSDENFSLTSEVELRHLANDGKNLTRHAGFGVCTLNKKGLTYVGTEDGKEITKEFSLDSIYRLLFGAGEDFEIYEGNEIYYFVPKEKRSAVTWYIISELLKK